MTNRDYFFTRDHFLAASHKMSRNKGTHRLLLSLCVMLFLCLPVFAQQHYFQNFSVEEGLPQMQVNGICQDELGRMWFATLSGISCFDGRSFRNYSQKDGLASNITTLVIADRKGRIWTGTNRGLSMFDGKQFTTYTGEGSENQVNALVEDNKGVIWAALKGKVHQMDGAKLKLYAHDRFRKFQVQSLFCDNKGSLWAAGVDSVLLQTGKGNWTRIAVHQHNPAKRLGVRQIYVDGKQRVWLLTNKGVFRLETDGFRPFTAFNADQIIARNAISMCEDFKGHLWFVGLQGVYVLDEKGVHRFSATNGFSNAQATQAFPDREGNLWFSTDGQGVFKYKGGAFVHFDESNGLAHPIVMSLLHDKQGLLWMGTYGGGLQVFDGKSIKTRLLPSESAASRRIVPIIRDAEDQLWIGTNGDGLWRYDGKKFTAFPKNDSLMGPTVFALYEDQSQRVWINTNKGIVIAENGTPRRWPPGEALKNTTPSGFLEIGKDSMLIACDQGLWLWDGKQLRHLFEGEVLGNSSILCLTYDKEDRRIWIGTNGSGLVCWNRGRNSKDSLEYYSRKEGLSSEIIYSLAFDQKGRLWAGTGNGINRIQYTGGGIRVRAYGKTDGVLGIETNQNAILVEPNGSVWFGTTKGLCRYNPESEAKKPVPFKALLTGVELFADTIPASLLTDSLTAWYNIPIGLKLGHRQNHLTFEFTCVPIADQGTVKFRYQLMGLDEQVSATTASRYVVYPDLPPGEYVFKVWAGDDDTGFVTEPATMVFEIIPPFYEMPWFQLLVVGILIGTGAVIQYVRARWKARHELELERLRKDEQDKVRRRVAEDFHDELGNKLTRISVLTEVLQAKLNGTAPEIGKIIGQMRENAAALYSGTKDILWSLHPESDNLYEILKRLSDFGTELFEETETEFSVQGLEEEALNRYRLPMDYSRNLMMIFKEALHNALKHAHAPLVSMTIELAGNQMTIFLEDNGAGFDQDAPPRKGQGLGNMQIRARRISAKLALKSAPEAGTTVVLRFQIPDSPANSAAFLQSKAKSSRILD